MARQSHSADLWRAARLWLLAPLVVAGCATTNANKPGDGFHSLGSSTAGTEPSWTEKLAAPFKAGSGPMENRATTANDSDILSLSKKPDKKNPNLIVAMAQMHERAGKFDEAEKQYQKALKLQPKHLGALMGYAHLQDRRGKLNEATELYQKAIAAHPKEAGAQNDLGLCYYRRKMLPEAQISLAKAVELAPERKLYRNNFATVLVDQGQLDEALAQLTAAHGQPVAHYNLGYLLTKKGDQNRALFHFQQAVLLDPTLVAAQQWVVKLQPQGAPAFAAKPPGEAFVPSVAQRYPVTNSAPPTNVQVNVPPQAGVVAPKRLQTSPISGNYQGAATDRWSAPPAAVRYPNQQTAGYTGTAALPPTPDQLRK